jgi:hypothetical protein
MTIKSTLLRLVTMDPSKPVRTAVAGVAATLAKIVFSSEGNWSEIFDLLIQLLQSPDEGMRALCFNLLGQVRTLHTSSSPDFLLSPPRSVAC